MIKGIAVAVASVALLAGCGDANVADLKNVPATEPTHIEVYKNIDGHPNVALLCMHGKTFLTTTRARFALVREPDLDFVCEEQAR